jgi:hypothetical protein
MGNNPKGIIFMDSVWGWSYADSTVIEEGLCKDLMNTESTNRTYYVSKCVGKYSKNYIFENPDKFVKKLYLFSVDYWIFPNLKGYQREIRAPQLRLWVLWIFFIFGTLGILISLQRFKEFLPLYLIMLGIWFSYALTVYLGRYKASSAPLSVIFAAGGIYGIWYLLGGQKKEHRKNTK